MGHFQRVRFPSAEEQRQLLGDLRARTRWLDFTFDGRDRDPSSRFLDELEEFEPQVVFATPRPGYARREPFAFTLRASSHRDLFALLANQGGFFRVETNCRFVHVNQIEGFGNLDVVFYEEALQIIAYSITHEGDFFIAR